MFYQDHIVEEVRELNDIVDIVSVHTNLKPAAGKYRGPCPLHGGANPTSFSVDPVRQTYYCYTGCGGGNVYSFVMATEGLNFKEAIERLADRVNYQLPTKVARHTDRNQQAEAYAIKDRIYQINQASATFFYENMKHTPPIIDYIKARGLTSQTVKRFGIGYALDRWDGLYYHLKKQGYSDTHIEETGLVAKNKKGGYYDRFRDRLMFPIIDGRKHVIGFGGRLVSPPKDGDDHAPKYINSPETPVYNKSTSLYGLNFVKRDGRELIVTEGYMDAITLYQAGFGNVVASLGTAFTQGHVKQLARVGSRVILVFDGDEAGVKAAMRAIEQLKTSHLDIRILTLPDNQDPDDYIKTHGAEAFHVQLQQATHYIDYQIQLLQQTHDLTDTSERIAFTKKAADTLRHLTDPLEKDAYIDSIAKVAGISKEVIGARTKEVLVLHAPQRQKSGLRDNKGLLDAQENIVRLVANSYFVYQSIVNYLNPTEMQGELYEKTLSLLYRLYSDTDTLPIARLLNYYTEPDELLHISRLLETAPNLDTTYLSKSLPDQIKFIKRAAIEARFDQAVEANDPNAAITRLEALKIVETLNISGFNG